LALEKKSKGENVLPYMQEALESKFNNARCVPELLVVNLHYHLKRVMTSLPHPFIVIATGQKERTSPTLRGDQTENSFIIFAMNDILGVVEPHTGRVLRIEGSDGYAAALLSDLVMFPCDGVLAKMGCVLTQLDLVVCDLRANSMHVSRHLTTRQLLHADLDCDRDYLETFISVSQLV